MDAERIAGLICDFVRTSPENSLKNEADEPAWGAPLIAFSSGADPLYLEYKEHVGPFHFTPQEIFNATFPDAPASPHDLTVISWILPHREPTKADNRHEKALPAERWVRARVAGEEFNNVLRRHVVDVLGREGIPALAPALSPLWRMETSPVFGPASRWSERHAAYAAGLGTFGLCDGLITAKGKAHRVGSVVARVRIPATTRPYRDYREYCLFFSKGSCRGCIERCPIGAITSQGHDKKACGAYVGGRCAEHARERFGYEGYGCGLCQTGVPCESRIA